jgi:predicted DNA-binding transcriptional regulator YafY
MSGFVVRKKSRLFALAEVLRGRRTGITAAELADRFGVTLRTIYRDIEALQDAGMPIRADRGRGGGYALDKSYQLPPVNFTAREAALLVALGRFAIDMRLLPFAGTLESGLDKVRAALSTSAQRELLTRIGELSFHGVPALPSKREVRAAIERAWFEQQPLRITYVDGGYIESKRDIRILSVAMDRHETRIEATDLEKNKPRQFRLDRITHAEVLSPASALPAATGSGTPSNR